MSELHKKLKNKEYRDALVAAYIETGVPFQIKALRQQRQLTQQRLAQELTVSQSAIAQLETVKRGRGVNVTTLMRLASAFDVALVVRFVPFSQLASWAEQLSAETLRVPSFSKDRGFPRRRSRGMKLLAPETDCTSKVLYPTFVERTVVRPPVATGNTPAAIGVEADTGRERRHYYG